MAEDTDLLENEIVENKVMGDYWKGSFFLFQKTGTYRFTNQRILFHAGFGVNLSLPYSDISSASLCNVGGIVKFLPTGILLTMKDGKKYRISIMKRKAILELIQSKLSSQ